MRILTALLLLTGCGDYISAKPLAVDSADESRPDTPTRQDTADASDDDTAIDVADDSGLGPQDTGEAPIDVTRTPADPGSGLVHVCKEWRFSGVPSGWTFSTDLLPHDVQPEDAARFVTGSDPYLWTSEHASLDECTVIDVVLKVTGGESTWQLFWERTTDGEFSEERSRVFQLWSDEEWHRYVFDLRDHSQWSGILNRLRIDPRSGDGAVEIRSIRLMKPEPTFPPPPDMSATTWLHTDVSGWPQTSSLGEVTLSDSQVCLDHTRAPTWEARECCDGVEVAANPWVFIYHPNLSDHGGQWYAATWEWMRPGQVCKARTSVAADHIKQSPFHPTSGWRPSAGETLYFMVSGLARGGERNHSERTNLVRLSWR